MISVYHDGLIFGYNGRILACVGASNGELVWRSREPGDGFLILVDGHLVIATNEGCLSIALSELGTRLPGTEHQPRQDSFRAAPSPLPGVTGSTMRGALARGGMPSTMDALSRQRWDQRATPSRAEKPTRAPGGSPVATGWTRCSRPSFP